MTTSISAVDLLHLARKIMVDHGFDIKLDPPDLRELSAIGDDLRDQRKRRDMRNLLWSSIDNEDSEDLDQIEFAERISENLVRLYIGIADVDACVSKQGHIDQFAFTNATSVYTGIHVFPMLPEELSTDRTSLRARVDREAMVLQLDVDQLGNVLAFDVYFAFVRNQAKLAYERVAAWLRNESAYEELESVEGLAEQIRLQEQLCLTLRQASERNGAISVQTLEARPIAQNGQVIDLKLTEANRAREMVQSFMTAANSSLAAFMEKNGWPIIQRIVRKPDRWPRIVELAKDLGHDLPAEPDSVALAEFVAARRTAAPEKFPEFSLKIVKLLGPGQYVVRIPGAAGEGHFGLAAHEYTHATAPNRRYADLVLQRIVKSLLRGESHPYTVEELTMVADRCMNRENAARKVERTMRKAAAAVLLAPRVGQTFDAIVTGASHKGTYVRLLAPPAEGRVVTNARGLDVGDQVKVRLLGTDYLQGFVDFEYLDGAQARQL